MSAPRSPYFDHDADHGRPDHGFPGDGDGLEPGPFLSASRGDAARRRAARLHDIRDFMSELRVPLAAPDLSDAILARVNDRRPFTGASERRWIWAGRLALAAGVALMGGVVFFIQRMSPESTNWAGRPAPLTSVLTTAETEVGASVSAVRASLTSVEESVRLVAFPVAIAQGTPTPDVSSDPMPDPSNAPAAVRQASTCPRDQAEVSSALEPRLVTASFEQPCAAGSHSAWAAPFLVTDRGSGFPLSRVDTTGVAGVGDMGRVGLAELQRQRLLDTLKLTSTRPTLSRDALGQSFVDPRLPQ